MAKARGINSGPVQKTLKENNVNSKVELYSLYASGIDCAYLGDESVGSKDLADWKCGKGHVFQCRPNDINKGSGCPYCNSTDMKYVIFRESCSTVEEYLQKLGDKVDLTYIGGFTKHCKKCTWKCKNNSEHPIFPMAPSAIVGRGQGCPYCTNKTDMKYIVYRAGCSTVEEYLNKLGERTGLVYIGGFYGTNKKANWRCKNNLEHPILSIKPNDVDQIGHGCSYCNGTDMKYVLLRENCKTLDEYGHKIALENPNNIKYIGGFVNGSVKAEWECSRNHRWETTPHCIKSGNGCPKCALQFSKKENDLFKEVQKIYPDATDRNRGLLKNTSYELDIYVPSLKKAIEFDGDYWHSLPKAIRRDADKDTQCTEAGITLYRVKESDWNMDKDLVIENVLEFLKP